MFVILNLKLITDLSMKILFNHIILTILQVLYTQIFWILF